MSHWICGSGTQETSACILERYQHTTVIEIPERETSSGRRTMGEVLRGRM